MIKTQTMAILIVASIVVGSDNLAWSQVGPVSPRYDAFTKPVRTQHLSFAQPGRVAKVMVDRGDRVTVGQPLMRLDRGVLEASKRIAELEAESTIERQQLQLEAKAAHERLLQLTQLQSQGAINPEEYKRGIIDDQTSSLKVQQAEDRRALAQLRVDEIQARLDQHEIVSDCDGLVIEVLREPGEYVSTGDPHVVTVVQLDQLEATFFVATTVADQYTAGDGIPLTIEGYDRPLTAKVLYVAPVTDADSGRVRMDVRIDNANRRIRSGLRATLLAKADHVATRTWERR